MNEILDKLSVLFVNLHDKRNWKVFSSALQITIEYKSDFI